MSEFKPYHLPHFHIRFQFQNINSKIAVVQSLSQCPVFGIPWPMICTTPGLPVLHYVLGSLLKLMSIESVMPSNHLILCHPLTSCSQSFPASGSFPVSRLFASSSQSIGALASKASVLPVNFQDWFPLGLTGLNSTVQGSLKSLLQHRIRKHQFFGS